MPTNFLTHLMTRQSKILWIIVAVMLAAVLSAIASVLWIKNTAVNEANEALLQKAVVVAASLDGDAVGQLTGVSYQMRSDAYQKTLQSVRRVKSSIVDSEFVYIMRLVDGELIFVADAEDPNSEDYSPYGSVYEDATEALKAVFVTGEPLLEGPVTDQWGTWASAIAAIYDTKGNITGVVGIDLPANQWFAKLVKYSWAAFGVLCSLALLILFSALAFQELMGMRKKALEATSRAMQDPLTKLHNRRYIMQMLEKKVAQSQQRHAQAESPFAVVFIDMNGLKKVNDTYGHSAGDLLLVEVSRRIVRCVRKSDAVARIGGDEFILVLDGVTSEQSIERTLQSLTRAVNVPSRHAELEGYAPSCSVGYALYPQHATTVDALIELADKQMYIQKAASRDVERVLS